MLLRADLNVPLDGTRITDDGRVRASLPTTSPRWPSAAPGSSCPPTWAGRKGAIAERAAGGPSLAPVAGHLAQLLGRPVAFAADVAGAVRRRGRRRPARRRRRAAGERALRARRDEQGRPGAGRAGRRLAALAAGERRRGDGRCTSATGSAPCTASTPACTTCRGCCRTRPATWCCAEVEVLRKLTADPAPAVRGGARRRQGLRQARRDRQPARPGGPAADRRRHVATRSWPRRATRSASRCSRRPDPARAPGC